MAQQLGVEWLFIWALASGIDVAQVECRTGVDGLCEKMYKFSPADVDQESGLGYIAGPAVDGWGIPVELGMDASILAKSGKTRQFAGRFGLLAPPKTFGYRPSPIGEVSRGQ